MTYKDILLRAPEPEDLELLYEWENNIEYWQISNRVTPFSKYVLKRHIETSHRSIYENGQLRLMIDTLNEGKTIGTIDLFDFDPYHSRAGVGILIAIKEERRKGYASMAIECLKNYCFETLRLNQLWCNIVETNHASIDLFSSAGFVKSGTRREWIRSGEEYLDQIFMQLIRSDDV